MGDGTTMKPIIELNLDCQCWPLWLYEADGTFIDNEIPESLRANKELMNALDSIQDQFDALYTHEPYTYPYIGFANPEAKERFIRDTWRAYELLCNAARKDYQIVYAIDYGIL